MNRALKLRAETEADLPAISAMVQDATIKVKDVAWLKRRHQFVLMLNRYRWESAEVKAASPGERVRSALRFDSVLQARFRDIPLADPEHVMGLLAIRFIPGDDGAGAVELAFSGFATIRLEVECLDIFLEDLTRPWRAIERPEHRIEPEEGDK